MVLLPSKIVLLPSKMVLKVRKSWKSTKKMWKKILILRSQPKILRKIPKKLRSYISAISRFLHVCSSGPRCLFFGDDGARLLDSHVSSMSPHPKPFQRQVVSSGKTYFRRTISKIEPKLLRYFFVHQIHEYLPTVTFCTHIKSYFRSCCLHYHPCFKKIILFEFEYNFLINPFKMENDHWSLLLMITLTNPMPNTKENIARIANAVQVTICLLVSTSVY